MVFGGTGSDSLRFKDHDCNVAELLILADLEGWWDGGGGATMIDNEGQERGE